MTLHFCNIFSLCCDFLSSKFTFLCLFYSSLLWTTPSEYNSFWTRSYPQQPSADNIWLIKSLWNAKNNGGNTAMPTNAWSAPNHSSRQIQNSSTTIIWQMNIDVQLTTHGTWFIHAFLFNVKNYSCELRIFHGAKRSWILTYRGWIILILNQMAWKQ